MENATKALLIAASVLIVIVLIAVGIKILGSAQGVTNEVGKVSEAMGQSVFNSQFTDYTGRQSAAQVKALVNKAAATHREGSLHKVNVTFNGHPKENLNDITGILSSINVNSFYIVNVYSSFYTGYIHLVSITSTT